MRRVTFRQAARLAKELEQKAKIDEKAAKGDSAPEVASEDGPKQFTLNLTKRNKDGRKPVKGDKVRVNYTGKLEDGTIFDSPVDEAWLKARKRKGAALMFKVGSNQVTCAQEQRLKHRMILTLVRAHTHQVIRGWDEAVRDMATGERATVTIEPAWAYGKKGVPEAGIPPDARLIFDMELVTIV